VKWRKDKSKRGKRREGGKRGMRLWETVRQEERREENTRKMGRKKENERDRGRRERRIEERWGERGRSQEEDQGSAY
jgi:hypothetical protein